VPTNNPEQYLSVFCLGKVEDGNEVPIRNMIYVHSKMMIVDDEYVLLGSANINQRSLGGDGDAEVCLGASQDDVLRQGFCRADGKVREFRVQLFAEHLGGQVLLESPEKWWKDAQTTASSNWTNFKHSRTTQGHLMR